MPIVDVHLLEGYDPQAKERLGRALTDAVRLIVPAPPDAVTVMMHEMAPAHYYRGGVQRTGAPALPDPQEIIRAYLSAMEARDLVTAQSMLGAGFVMQFPGAAPMTALSELITWSIPRYQSVTKTYEGFDTATASDVAVVYCRGTLSGVWLNGDSFDGIRFIDRFELQDGKITKQDVWNDMAEAKGTL